MPMVESVFKETDEADGVVGLVLAVADHACRCLEHTGPLVVEPDD